MEILIWIVAAIGFVVIDLLTSSFLFIWFAVGAMVSLILVLFKVNIYVQVITFFMVSIVLTIWGYPILLKRFKANIKKNLTMEESYIGRIMIALEDMGERSRINVNGIYWTAYNKGNPINKGKKFRIIAIEGNKLVVQLEEEELC